ncbi:MAG: hypothetical protein ACRELE_11375 [Gemmatimonadales bacterium]
MVRTAATLMLLLQLRPFAAAAVCLHQMQGSDQACAMSMPASASPADNHAQQHPTRSPQTADCPLAELCAVPAAVVLPVAFVAVTSGTTVIVTASPYVRSIHPADPVAPPVPPPNS